MTPEQEAATGGKLFVCRTCERDAPVISGQSTAGEVFGRAVLAAAEGSGVPVRLTPCLNGCLKHCNAGLRGRDRWTYRFSRLVPADAAALVEAARMYLSAPEGELDLEKLPSSLRDKMTVRTPPPHRLAAE